MADIDSLLFPKKSHRKAVHLPEPSAELGEFFGIMIGDGGINNPWQATITLNAIKDLRYSKYVSGLIKRLFRITPYSFKYKDRDALRIQIAGVSIVDFLVSKGLVRGNKLKQGLKIPEWILREPAYKLACVRGLVDTDGCIYVHVHSVGQKTYKNIGLTFSSRSPELIFQVAGIFEEFGIIPHISTRGHDIYLYRADSVEAYMATFGTSNERISSVLENWKRGRVVEGARLESV